jgi:hypothetical protein
VWPSCISSSHGMVHTDSSEACGPLTRGTRMVYLVLLKAPFTLVRAGLYYRCSTASHTAPSDMERETPRGLEHFQHLILTVNPIINKVRRPSRRHEVVAYERYSTYAHLANAAT